MGSVTKTIMEGVGDVMESTSYHFSSFEDFMEYERDYERDVGVMNSGTTAPARIIVDEPMVEVAQAPLTELEVGKKYRVIKDVDDINLTSGIVIVVTRDVDLDGDYKVELLDGSNFWYIKPEEVGEI